MRSAMDVSRLGRRSGKRLPGRVAYREPLAAANETRVVTNASRLGIRPVATSAIGSIGPAHSAHMITLRLPTARGELEPYQLGEHPPVDPVPGPWSRRGVCLA